MAARQEDFDGAREAIREAETLGCSPGQVQMLHGQAALYQDQLPLAIKHLEEAVELLPDSVAAWSMLAVAYQHSGQMADYNRALAEATRLPAVTPEDLLFRGHAESLLDPERGLRTLDESIHRRPSVLARLVRVEVLTMYIMDAPDPKKARLAMEDVHWIKRQFPDNAVALSQSLVVHVMCYFVYGEFQELELRQTALEEGWQDAHALERYPIQPAQLPPAGHSFRPSAGRMSH